MMRLLKLCLLGAIAALGVFVGRRLLELEEESAAPPQSNTPTGGSRENGAGAGDGETREELYREAQELDVEGRSKMNKRQLKDAVDAAKTGGNS